MLAFQSLADQLHLLDLIDQLTIFVIDPILVQFTAIDVVTAAALCSRAPKNEQLLVFLVVADRLGPAGLWTPTTLHHSSPNLRLKVVDHDIVQASRLDLIVDLIDLIVHARSIDLAHVEQVFFIVAESVVILASVDQ